MRCGVPIEDSRTEKRKNKKKGLCGLYCGNREGGKKIKKNDLKCGKETAEGNLAGPSDPDNAATIHLSNLASSTITFCAAGPFA